ncbi:MAG: DUF1302 domain-containing protein [Bermanella sp.]
MNRKLSTRSLLFCAISSIGATQAHAADFYFGSDDETTLQINSQLSLGASWRTESADAKFIDISNGGQGQSSTSDDGNLNYDKGDAFSKIIKGSHDLQLTHGNFGAFTRIKYWSDLGLEDGDVLHGNAGSNYQKNQPLSDNGFSDNAKFSGISLLDAYVYGSFDIGEMPLDVRVGRQVLSWGESTFIQGGMNSTNPFDVSALRRPGATLKEGILPVGMVFANIGVSENLSLEAFYQYEWAKTEIDGCGTLFAIDVVASGCNVLTAGSVAAQFTADGSMFDDQAAQENGFYVARNADVEAKDGGQYGLAARYFAAELNDTEFGLYFMNIHSRLPMLNVVRNTHTGTTAGTPTTATATGIPFVPSMLSPELSQLNASYQIEFPEDLKYYALSFATNAFGTAFSGEVSYKPDTPIQINGISTITGILLENPAATPYANRVIAAEPGAVVKGYDEFDVTQVQVTAIQFVDRVLGASRLTLIAEVGATFVDGIENAEFVYGRDAVFGVDLASDGGFVTDSAWGYRTKASLDYSDVYAGISLTPTVSWGHDVEGYSPAPGQQFLEGRKTLGLSLDASYQQTYNASLGYQQFSGGRFNNASDKDFASLSLSVLY